MTIMLPFFPLTMRERMWTFCVHLHRWGLFDCFSMLLLLHTLYLVHDFARWKMWCYTLPIFILHSVWKNSVAAVVATSCSWIAVFVRSLDLYIAYIAMHMMCVRSEVAKPKAVWHSIHISRVCNFHINRASERHRESSKTIICAGWKNCRQFESVDGRSPFYKDVHTLCFWWKIQQSTANSDIRTKSNKITVRASE